jgi:hypothetical protein
MSSPPVRIACCGGQLVKSAHPETSLGSDAEFPERLQQRLGERYEVGNFGYASAYVCSVCVDAAGPGMPEWAPSLLWHKSPPAAACAEFLPDVILLGPFGKHDCLAPFGWLDRMDEESYDRAPLFTQENWEAGLREMVLCENRLCFPTFKMLNMLILPRQARGKHKGKLKNKMDFSGAGAHRAAPGSAHRAAPARAVPLREHRARSGDAGVTCDPGGSR